MINHDEPRPKTTNPRKGTETVRPALDGHIPIDGPKTTNPRKGTETNMNVVFGVDDFVSQDH